MGAKPSSFKKKLLASSISSCLLASVSVYAQTDEPAAVEEVIVLGVRGAQESAVNLKRDSAGVVDGIVAEDIGKLPDATISDSLQRISGIQIQRSAGEGGSVNIRGLPQVVTQLNGEQYLGAGSVTEVQPDFGDIPSQLFKGAEVYKSNQAGLVTSGITGTINLQTRRPFDFDEGITVAGSAEAQYGEETTETDPVVSGLFNWKGDRVGAMIAVAFANVNLANYYNGVNTGEPTGDLSWVNGVNDWGAAQQYNSIASQGWVAFNQITERERMGLNGSFQADLGNGLEFVADWFYTNQDEYNRKVGMGVNNRWSTLNWYTPRESRLTGNSRGATGQGGTSEWLTYQTVDLDVRRLYSFTQNDSFLSDSNNINLELNYDNGGDFTGSIRAVMGKANRDRRHGYNEGDMYHYNTDGMWEIPDGIPFYPDSVCDALGVPVGERAGVNGGCFFSPNPGGITQNAQLNIDFRTEHPTWSGWGQSLPSANGTRTLAEHMADIDTYAVGAFSSENNFDSEGKLNVIRFDGNQKLDEGGFFTSVDVGLRLAQRSVENTEYHLFSPFYATESSEGCYAQWKAIDVYLQSDTCQVGENLTGNGGAFEAYTALPPTRLDQWNNVMFVTDYGPIKGIPGVWAADPKDYDDPEAFHNRVFGSTRKAIIPGNTYEVDLDETTFYVQGNFESGAVSGNVGVRVVDTTLSVLQNIAGPQLPHGNTNTDIGDVLTTRRFVDVLPAANVAVDLSEDMKLRFAASKTMTPLDMEQWGDGLVVNYSIASNDPAGAEDGTFIVNSATLDGNPELDPWRATNLDASFEYYLGGASVVSVGAFYIDVAGFTQATAVSQQIPDADGVQRRTTRVSTNVAGKNGTLRGAELGAKLAFVDFIDAPVISDFGIDANYTYSPSEQEALDIQGRRMPFPQNSKDQVNFVLWYQGGPFQARAAYNYRSDRLAESNRTSGGLNLWQDATSYVDISASYDISENFTVYLSGSNVTGEYEEYYVEWEDQYAFQNYYEARYTLGVRARF